MTFQSFTEEYFSRFLYLSFTHGFGRVLNDYCFWGHTILEYCQDWSIYTEFCDVVFMILKTMNSFSELELPFRKLLSVVSFAILI